MKKNFNHFLLALIAFFATWGEGMQNVLPKASVIYPLLVVIYMVLNYNNLIVVMRHRRIVPKEFRYLFVFVCIHTLIYVFLNASSIGFGVKSVVENEEGFSYGRAANGVVILRYFIFLAFCLYLSVALGNEKKLKIFAKYYVIGFMGTILLGGAFHGYENALVRFSGGLQDPNSMAFDALIALLFSLYLYNQTPDKSMKMIMIASFVVEAAAIFLSFSRGAWLALELWGVMYLIHKGVVENLWKFIISSIVVFIVGTILVKTMNIDTELLEIRFSIEEMKEKKGAGRGLIWEVYLTNMDKYFVTGMGINNSPKVMQGNSMGISEHYESHNLYIQWLAEYGFIGLILYLLYLKGFLAQFRRTKGNNWYLMSMGGVFLVVTFFLNIDKGRTFWIVLAVLNMVWMGNWKQLNKKRTNESYSAPHDLEIRHSIMFCIVYFSTVSTQYIFL